MRNFRRHENKIVVTTATVVVAAAIALAVVAIVAIVMVMVRPAQAIAAELQTASVTVTLPNGANVTVPDGSSIDLSKGTSTTTTTAAAVKKASTYWKASGLQTYGAKYGWSVKTTWSAKGSTKAVCTREFSIPAAKQKQGKSLRMRITQTTWSSGGKWSNKWTGKNASGQTKAFKASEIKKSLRDYGKK